MKTRKHIFMAAAFVLLAGLGTAMGQGKMNKNGATFRLPPEPIGPVVKINAFEVTDGSIGYRPTKEETMFGYTFLGRTSGSLPGSITLSMNCTPATPTPGGSSALTGGSWTLPIYMTEVRGGYAGSLFGTIVKGTMTWDKTGTNANIYFVLNVDGGTQSWEGIQGYATFAGTLFVDEKTQKTMLTGEMVFNLIGTAVQ
jgi:hypothetical protein